jgi:catechol 2,3-dioxygenase-like lactoylglutathione lyase family enzyme
MSTLEMTNERPPGALASPLVDLKLEVAILPVSDVDRAKRFYVALGWRLDADFPVGDAFRVVQFTPPGSPCSIHFGKGITTAPPGSAREYLVVSDIAAARAQLLARGADVSEIFNRGVGEPKRDGRDAEGRSYVSYATFCDPDGNGWVLQEVTARLPGRGFGTLDVPNLTALLREAEKQHTQYEPTAPRHHWSGFYAAYVVARQRGGTPEAAVKAAVLEIEGQSGGEPA